MKVLCITPTLNPESGGWGRYSYNIVKFYKNNNIDFVVCTEEKTKLFSEEKAVLDRYSFRGLIMNIFKVRMLAKKFDVVHAFDGWPFGIYAYFAVLGTSKRLFISGVGTYSVAPLSSLFKGFFLKKAYSRAQAIFCISNYTNKSIKSEVREAKTKTIFMGLSKLPNLTNLEIETYKHQYEIKNSPVILTVGAIKHRKGQLDTLKAINILKGKFPNILYIMIGSRDDNYVNKIEEYIRQNSLETNVMIFSESLSDKILSFFYISCDLFVLNSNNLAGHFEGFGLAILEAAQFGKAAVGSIDCGIEDAIEDGVTGYLSKQGDEKNIAEKIELGLVNNANLGRCAKDRAEKFDWHSTAKEYLNFYET